MLSILLSLLMSLSLAAAPPAPIQTVLNDFTEGAASRDADRVGRALHPEARQYVHMPDGLQVIGTEAYLGLLRAGKLGGTPTTSTVHDVELGKDVALVQQTRDIGAMRLHDAVTLMRDEGRWTIISVIVAVEPKS